MGERNKIRIKAIKKNFDKIHQIIEKEYTYQSLPVAIVAIINSRHFKACA